MVDKQKVYIVTDIGDVLSIYSSLDDALDFARKEIEKRIPIYVEEWQIDGKKISYWTYCYGTKRFKQHLITKYEQQVINGRVLS